MDGFAREAMINAAFVAVADTLASNYEPNSHFRNLVVRCTEVASVFTGVVMLADISGDLEVVAFTGIDSFGAKLMSTTRGPGSESNRLGAPVTVASIAEETEWTEFRTVALKLGFQSALAVPLRVRTRTLGAVLLFSRAVEDFSPKDSAVIQALIDVAIIGMLQERMIREGRRVEEQLRRTLDTRVFIV